MVEFHRHDIALLREIILKVKRLLLTVNADKAILSSWQCNLGLLIVEIIMVRFIYKVHS